MCKLPFIDVTNFILLFLHSGDIFKDCPPEYDDNKRFKCTFKGCVFTAPNKNAYVSHRGGVHWEGLLDKYLSEMGKNIDLDGTWPDKEIKMIEYGSRGKAKVNDSNMKKGSPVVSTPKNDTVKKRGRPTSFNSPDVPCSPTTKRKLKDITVSEFSSNPSVPRFISPFSFSAIHAIKRSLAKRTSASTHAIHCLTAISQWTRGRNERRRWSSPCASPQLMTTRAIKRSGRR